MTAIGHFSLVSETKYNPSIVTFVINLTSPATGPDASPLSRAELCQLWKERGMSERHPRFHRSISADRPGYFQKVNYGDQRISGMGSSSSSKNEDAVEKHVSDTIYPINRQDLQARIEHLQMATWDLSDSLWQMYVAGLPAWNERRKGLDSAEKAPPSDEDHHAKTMLIFRGHHSLGDGASMGAVLMDLFDEAKDYRRQISLHLDKRKAQVKTMWERLRKKVHNFLRFVIGSLKAISYQAMLYWYGLFEENPWPLIKQDYEKQEQRQPIDIAIDSSGGARLRTVSWTGGAAPVDQVKWVARQLVGPKATVNDVFVSCVTGALARQLDDHRKRIRHKSHGSIVLPPQTNMNVSVPVHLKGGIVLPGESIGNNIGAFVVRVPGEINSMTSEERLKSVHNCLNEVKTTPAPILSYLMAKSLSYATPILPSSWISYLFQSANAGSVAVVTNVRGPPTPVHLAGRRIDSILGFVPLAPGLPVGVVVGSYAGRMQLTLTAEPWAVPDADRFLRWVLEEYISLVDAASKT